MADRILPGARSDEDQDLLERSTKKSKVTMHVQPPFDVAMDWEEANAHSVEHANGTGNKSMLSYKNKLTGEGNDNQSAVEGVETVSDDEEDERSGNDDNFCPRIKLTKEEKRWIRNPWKQTLIIKVMGRRVGYAYLLRRITAMWHPKSRMELVALDNDYFLVKFASIDDYKYAKFEGPWMVMDHYLIVKEWVPNFDPVKDTTEHVLVWVRFSGLSIEYYNHLFLYKVGEKIGKPIKIDEATSLVSRGRFARMCIEVDITKPLLAYYKLRGKVRAIEYEGIHLVCFHCGMYGHTSDACSNNDSMKEKQRPPEEDDAGGTTAPVPGQTRKESSAKGNDQYMEEKSVISVENPGGFGPWMLANRSNRRPNRGYTRKENHPNGQWKGREIENTSSRFHALQSEDQDDYTEKDQMGQGMEYKNDNNKTNGNKVRPNGKLKGKRQNVQAHENQIIGDNYPMGNLDKAGPSSSKSDRENRAKKVEKKANQAAAVDEHTLVTGVNFGTSITRTFVMSQESEGRRHGSPELSLNEHHSDPPYVDDTMLIASSEDGDTWVDGDPQQGGEAMDL